MTGPDYKALASAIEAGDLTRLSEAAAAITALLKERDEARAAHDFLFRSGVEPAIALERERCARISETVNCEMPDDYSPYDRLERMAIERARGIIAAAIRSDAPPPE